MIFLILVFVLLLYPALTSAFFETPIGVGGLVGVSSQGTVGGVVIEGQNHFDQGVGSFGLNQYGEGQARGFIGSRLGLALEATSGITLYGLNQQKGSIGPHLGIEPFSGQIVWNSGGIYTNFY